MWLPVKRCSFVCFLMVLARMMCNGVLRTQLFEASSCGCGSQVTESQVM